MPSDLKEAARVVRLHAEFVGKNNSESRQRRAVKLRALADRLDARAAAEHKDCVKT